MTRRKTLADYEAAVKSEADLMRLFMVALSERGHLVYRANVGILKTPDGRTMSTGLPPGFPDLFGCTAAGEFFAIEVKLPPEKGGKGPSREQTATLQMMRQRGIRCGVARTVARAVEIVESINPGANRDE